MGIAFRKVWRDMRNNLGRTALVVASIAIGVLALGLIVSGRTLMARQMMVSQAESHPTTLRLSVGPAIDDATLRMIRRQPGVEGARGVIFSGIRWKPSLEAAWTDATLTAIDDYTDQTYDLITLREGGWPATGRVAIEHSHVAPYAVPPVGGTLFFEVNGRAKPMTLAGVVRDPREIGPPFTSQPTFYVTRNTLVSLGLSDRFNSLQVAVADFSQERAEAVQHQLTDRLETLGVGVNDSEITAPDRHFLQDVMDGVTMILTVMALLSLGMSTILVINTINAILAQQVPQIGIMKTIGGLRGQITGLYLAGVIIYGLLSLMLAMPIGAFGGWALARWLMALINVTVSDFEVLPSTLGIQFVTGLVVPVLAAFWPIVQGSAISVREAVSQYGLGTGNYGSRWIDRVLARVQGLPRTWSMALRNTFRRMSRAALTEVTLIGAGVIFMMVISAQHSFETTLATIFRGFGYDVILGFSTWQRIDRVTPLLEAQPNVDRVELWQFANAQTRLPDDPDTVADRELLVRGIPRDTQLFTPELTAGRPLLPEDDRALLLNQDLAGEMGVGIGQRIQLDFGDGTAQEWTVVGLIYDLAGRGRTAYLYRDTLARDLGFVGRGSVAEIRLQTNSLEAQLAAEAQLREALEDQGISVSFTRTQLLTREEAGAQFSILTSLLLIMTGLIGLVGAIGLSGTLSINVLERRREIGVMRAVGASSLDIGVVFMGEGLLLGVASWLASVPLAVVAGQWFVSNLNETIDFNGAYYFAEHSVWIWLGIVVSLSLLASWLPARRAAAISVRESLAYE
ncbi:MAG: ABC transporter permease [Anaerolineales bacterium]|nr:ABC transporter permease [Anaerolineales bacterium]